MINCIKHKVKIENKKIKTKLTSSLAVVSKFESGFFTIKERARRKKRGSFMPN